MKVAEPPAALPRQEQSACIAISRQQQRSGSAARLRHEAQNGRASQLQVLPERCSPTALFSIPGRAEKEGLTLPTGAGRPSDSFEERTGRGCLLGGQGCSPRSRASAHFLLLRFKVKHFICTNFQICLSQKPCQVIRIIITIIRP